MQKSIFDDVFGEGNSMFERVFGKFEQATKTPRPRPVSTKIRIKLTPAQIKLVQAGKTLTFAGAGNMTITVELTAQ